MNQYAINSQKNSLLVLPVRRKIYGIVKNSSGCHFREIERRCKLSTGLVKYHLDFLVKHQLIKQEKMGNNVRYFSIGLSLEEKKILSFLRMKSTRDIIIALLEERFTHKEIVDFVNLAPSTVSWHLQRLRNTKIILIENNKYYFCIEKKLIIKLLIAYKESFLDSLVNRVVEMWEV